MGQWRVDHAFLFVAIKVICWHKCGEYSLYFKPGAARAWFTKIIPGKVCVCTYLPIYLSLSVHTDPREQTILVAKGAFIQEI